MKKTWTALLLCAALLLALAACGGKSAPERTVTLQVTAGEESRSHTVTSSKPTLGEALLDAGLIAGEEGPYGLYVKSVDGISADESKEQWWCLTKDGQSVNTGVDSTEFAHGDRFEFTLMEGY